MLHAPGRTPRNRARNLKLSDGTQVTLRPIRPEDKPLIAAAYDRMSVDSRYRRFFRNLPELSPAMLAYLTEVDHVDHEAIVATKHASPETVLGVARFVRGKSDPEAAEVAFAVVDDWQGRGLGRALLTHLARRAREEGVRRFVALVKFDNEEALGLLRTLDEVKPRQIGPELEIQINLPPKRGMGQPLRRFLRAAATGALTTGRHVLERAPTSRSGDAPSAWRSIRTIIVGADGSPSAQVAVEAAVDIASRFDATLSIVCAYPGSESRPEALSALSRIQATCVTDLAASSRAVEGRPADVLVAAAEDAAADLIVIGNRRMNGPGRIMGSVPTEVSHHAPCAVLIVQTTG